MEDFFNEIDSEDAANEILRCIGEQIEEENNKNAFLNVARARELFSTYQILSRIVRGTKTKVTYSMNKPYISMGVVSVEGADLMFDKPKLFKMAANLASNVNIYPKTNGLTHIDFTFHNLTIQSDIGGN